MPNEGWIREAGGRKDQLFPDREHNTESVIDIDDCDKWSRKNRWQASQNYPDSDLRCHHYIARDATGIVALGH
jgi:hypothetical protein